MDVIEKLRQLGSIETSQLYSQRKTLNEAADEIERLRGEADKWEREAMAQQTRRISTEAEAAALREALEMVLPYMEAAESAGLVGDEGCHWAPEIVRGALASGAGEKAAASAAALREALIEEKKVSAKIVFLDEGSAATLRAALDKFIGQAKLCAEWLAEVKNAPDAAETLRADAIDAEKALASGAGEKAAAVLKAAEAFVNADRHDTWAKSIDQLFEAVAAWKGD